MLDPRVSSPFSSPTSWADRIGLWAFAVACGLTVTVLGLSPRAQAGTVAVIFPPWVAADAVLVAATESGARLVGAGRVPFVVIVAPDSADYVARVRSAGALFSLDAAGFVGCLAGSSART